MHLRHWISVLLRVWGWILLNMLKLNDDKTEFLLIAFLYYIKKVSTLSLVIGNTEVHSVTQVKNIGVIFDSNLSVEKFVSAKYNLCMFYIRSISRIRM